MNFQIKSIEIFNKKITLSQATNNSENIYTLITGKNGLGKTRILNTIILNYLRDTYKPNLYWENPDYEAFKALSNLKIASTMQPKKIIAHTNSMFSRFPNEREANTKIYSKPHTSSDYHQRNNIFYKLLLSKDNNFSFVSDTLSYLGYTSLIAYKFVLIYGGTPKGYLEKMVSTYREALIELDFDLTIAPQKLPPIKKRFLCILYYIFDVKSETLNFEETLEIYRILNKYNLLKNFTDIEVILNLDEKNVNYTILSKNDFHTLLNFDVLSLRSIYLYNNDLKIDIFNSDKRVIFENLSSGQKSIINTLLGISSSIENYSLICIDEPEISLHPEWQEEIIFKIQQVFQDIKGCHFLIATHSPQVVAGLNVQNGFIVNLETMEMHNSTEYFHKSADFQLANIFNAPGYNNEYLIRISLVILSKLAKGEFLSLEDQEHFKTLKYIQPRISENDPVYYLIKQVLTMAE